MNTTFRCSSLDRALACPGSTVLCGIVDPRDGTEGAEGTELHRRSAVRLVTEYGATAAEDADITGDNAKPLFGDWIVNYYVRQIAETVPQDWAMEVEAGLAYDFDFGCQVPYIKVDWVDGRPVVTQSYADRCTISGHIDCFAISPDGTEAIGFDLKTGYDPVDEAESNWQMLGYIILLFRAYPSLTKVTFYIVQPRNDEDEGFPRVSHVTVTNLEAATELLVSKCRHAVANADEIETGRVQCKWCAAAKQCPAAKAVRDLMKMKLTPEAVAQIKRTPDDATLADWVIAGRIISRPLDDAEKLAKERIEKEGQITATDGTVITQKEENGSYKVLNPYGLWGTVAELLPEKRRALCAKWSMTAIKDQIAEELNVPKSGKAAVTAESVFDAKVRVHVEQGKRRKFVFSQ